MAIGFEISFKINTNNYNKKLLKGNILILKKIIVAIAGPMVNLILILIFSRIKTIFGIKTEILIYVNILIFLFNTITIYPLDGGRILKCILHIFLGNLNALKIIYVVSNFTALILSILVILITIYLRNFLCIVTILYIWNLVIKENKIIKMKIKMYKILKNCIAIN